MRCRLFQIEDEISRYSTTNDLGGGFNPGRGVPEMMARRRKRSIYWGWWSASDAAEIFDSSGVVVLTNAYVHSRDRYLGEFATMIVPLFAVACLVYRMLARACLLAATHH